MNTYRATIWVLTAAANAVDGDAGITRHVVEARADSRRAFEAQIRDRYSSDVDNGVWFGPISDVTVRRMVERANRTLYGH